MKRLFFLLFFSLILFGCAKQPLTLNLTAEKTSAYIHSQDSFYCSAQGGKEQYSYLWKINNKPITCSGNQCNMTFDKIGKYDITCEVSDGKEKLNKSISLEVTKIPKMIECIYGFGDSLTEAYGVNKEDSWISLYSKNFKNSHLFNYAVSDSTSYDVLNNQVTNILLQSYACFNGYSIIFLWFGANDIKKFVSTQEFNQNYIKIIESLDDMSNSTILLITIPDVSKLSVADDINQQVNDFTSLFGIQLDVKQIGRDVINQYNDIIKNIAKTYNFPVIDMFSYMEKFDESLVGNDRFHPNEKGHEAISKVIKTEVENFFKDYNLY
jgi:lysophospholipase L1-like esterase